MVESDRSLIGMVYATDAIKSQSVRVIFQVPNEILSVDYFCVTLKSSAAMLEGRPIGKDFRQYLLSQTAANIFEQHGFAIHCETD